MSKFSIFIWLFFRGGIFSTISVLHEMTNDEEFVKKILEQEEHKEGV